MFMRESGFSWVKTLLGQDDLVGAVAHIAPAGLKCASNQSIRSLNGV